MRKKKQREIELFGLSFLDCMCCGFGAILLIFVLTTGRGLRSNEDKLAAFSREVVQLETSLVEAQDALERARDAFESVQSELQQEVQAENTIQQEVASKKAELDNANAVLSARQKALEEAESVSDLIVNAPPESENLGGFDVTGKRVLFLLEASGGMLGETVPEAIDRLKLAKSERAQSPKWQRALKSAQPGECRTYRLHQTDRSFRRWSRHDFRPRKPGWCIPNRLCCHRCQSRRNSR